MLEKACATVDGLSAKYPPKVMLNDFGGSAVNYNIYVYIENPWKRRMAMSQLNEAVWWGLKEAGIEIAFPQLDVHLDQRSDVIPP